MYIMFSLLWYINTKITPNHFTLMFFGRLFREKGTIYYVFISFEDDLIFSCKKMCFICERSRGIFISVYEIIMVKVIARQTDIPL